MFRTHTTSAPIETLKGLYLFRSCDDADLAQVDQLATWIRVETGRVLCHEEKPGRECFVILDGEVVVSQRGRDLHRLGPGAAFGEMALIDLGPRVATVTATEPSELGRSTPPPFG